MSRYAIVNVKNDIKVVARYLPSNYTVEYDGILDALIIGGFDVAGWTLDGYVIPRLRSGNIVAREVIW